MYTVELRPAWGWTCNSCGRDTFVRAIVPESLEGQLPEGYDPEDFEGGDWITKPDRVRCSHCGVVFRVEAG